MTRRYNTNISPIKFTGGRLKALKFLGGNLKALNFGGKTSAKKSTGGRVRKRKTRRKSKRNSKYRNYYGKGIKEDIISSGSKSLGKAVIDTADSAIGSAANKIKIKI